MFGSVLGKATGFLEKRFVLDLVLPCLVFTGGITLLAARGTRWPKAVAFWTSLTGFEQVLVIGAAVTFLLIFAFVAGGRINALTRLWEGYWPGALGRLTKLELARWRRLDLTDDDAYTTRYYGFPAREADVLPTRLGNTLRAAETYPGDRYGADAVFLWPRLYVILPADARTEIGNGRSSMDRMVLLASLAAAFPLVSLGTSWWAGTGWKDWLIGALVSLAVAVVAYRAAVAAAQVFGDLVRAAFDLYRRDLLKKLGFAPPRRPEDERELWTAVQQQLYRRAADRPELIRYEP